MLYDTLAGPVLTVAAALVGAWVLARLLLYLAGLVKRAPEKSEIPAAALPLGRAGRTKPVYLALLYLGHLGLLVLCFGLPYHSFALFELPEVFSERATLALMGLVVLSLIGFVVKAGRGFGFNLSRFLPAVVLGAVLASGYLMAFSSAGLPWLDENMALIHLISALVLLVLIAFLTTVNRFNPTACTGCAACHWNCPTQAIGLRETDRERIFIFDPALCLRCGRCLAVCPENAARIRHRLEWPWRIIFTRPQEVARVELAACSGCGKPVATRGLARKVGRLTGASGPVELCPECREKALVEFRKGMHPESDLGAKA